MADIFLSYSSEDKDRVEPLVRALERAGRSVWWDRKTPVPKHSDDETRRELESAGCVVVVWSISSIVSKYVRIEAAYGNIRGIIVPAKIDPVNLPDEFWSLKPFNLVGLTEYSTSTAFQHLVASINEKIKMRMPAYSPNPTPPDRKGPIDPPKPSAQPERANQKQESSPRIEPQPDTPTEGNPPIGRLICALLAIVLIVGWIVSDDNRPQVSEGAKSIRSVKPLTSTNLSVPQLKSTVTVTLQLPMGEKLYFYMVPLPFGRFMMGSPPQEKGRDSNEGPQHRVYLHRFEIGKYEVTQALWRAVMGTDPSEFKGDYLPVENVSWNAAQEFCSRLNYMLGLTGSNSYRLPTEAEWEYAARAGTTTPFAFGQTITTDIVNYDGRYPYDDAPRGIYRAKTVPVGSLCAANAWGLYDMHGNVWEWVEDQYRDSYTGAPSDGRAWTGLGMSAQRVFRGGSWYADAVDSRAAIRVMEAPGYYGNHLGFRIARTLP